MNYSSRITIRDHIVNLQEIVDDKKYYLSSMSFEDMYETNSEIQLLEEEIEYCKIRLLESETAI